MAPKIRLVTIKIDYSLHLAMIRQKQRTKMAIGRLYEIALEEYLDREFQKTRMIPASAHPKRA